MTSEDKATASADKITGLVDHAIEKAEPLAEKVKDSSGKYSAS